MVSTSFISADIQVSARTRAYVIWLELGKKSCKERMLYIVKGQKYFKYKKYLKEITFAAGLN